MYKETENSYLACTVKLTGKASLCWNIWALSSIQEFNHDCQVLNMLETMHIASRQNSPLSTVRFLLLPQSLPHHLCPFRSLLLLQLCWIFSCRGLIHHSRWRSCTHWLPGCWCPFSWSGFWCAESFGTCELNEKRLLSKPIRLVKTNLCAS